MRQNYYKQEQTANVECIQFDERVERVISSCPIMAKEQYIQRHDRVCGELHCNICKEMGENDKTNTAMTIYGNYVRKKKKKKTTVTKLGIYSTFSPRSSINFLDRCSKFCKPLKKIINLSVQPGLRGRNDIRVGKKMATLRFFLSSREQVVVRRDQICRRGWVIKSLEAKVGQVLLGYN